MPTRPSTTKVMTDDDGGRNENEHVTYHYDTCSVPIGSEGDWARARGVICYIVYYKSKYKFTQGAGTFSVRLALE